MIFIFRPIDFGIHKPKAEVIDAFVKVHKSVAPLLTIDSLLVQPRLSLKVCDLVRATYGWPKLTDEAILRSLITRRKAERKDPNKKVKRVFKK